MKSTHCDIVVYDKKYIVDLQPYSWHRVPKIFQFPKESNKSIFYYINEVTLRKHRTGASPQSYWVTRVTM